VRQNSWFLSRFPHDLYIPLPSTGRKKRVASNWIYAVSATRCIIIIAPECEKRKGRNRKNSRLQVIGNFVRIAIGRDRSAGRASQFGLHVLFLFSHKKGIIFNEHRQQIRDDAHAEAGHESGVSADDLPTGTISV
jgi:hypothetical protein